MWALSTRSVKCQRHEKPPKIAGILFAVCFSVLALFSRVFSGETQPTVKIFVAAVARVTSGKYRYALSHKFLALENKTQKNPETRKRDDYANIKCRSSD